MTEIMHHIYDNLCLMEMLCQKSRVDIVRYCITINLNIRCLKLMIHVILQQFSLWSIVDMVFCNLPPPSLNTPMFIICKTFKPDYAS